MRKIYNFSPGPAIVPYEVLLKAQEEMLDWQNLGMSVMEISHRSRAFENMAEETRQDLRELMSIPKNYHILFLAGGATTQFSMVPLNLLSKTKKADYVDTGVWSKKAASEAKRYGNINLIQAIKKENELHTIVPITEWGFNDAADYMHYTPNETISGIQFHFIPQHKNNNVPLIADMTSYILAENLDVSQFGLIYAGAQKNLGQAGLTVVIIRDDLVTDSLPFTPILYQYKIQVENQSFYNTPPTYAWYFTSLVLKWLKKMGGVKKIAAINQQKAKKLYQLIDECKDFYTNSVHQDARSIMNVVFNLTKEHLTEIFLKEAAAVGLLNLKGHRLQGGIRASIYNAMPEKGVDKLVSFMKEFRNRYA